MSNLDNTIQRQMFKFRIQHSKKNLQKYINHKTMALTGVQAYPIAHGKNNTGGGGTTVINNNGGGGIPSDISINSITAEQGNINTLGGIDLNYDKGTFMEMTSGEGQINNLGGENINYASGRIGGFQSENGQIGSLNADEISALKAYIRSLMSDEITTQYLTVTKQAHFFELIIDKVKSAGGTLLLSQANAVVDYVKAKKKTWDSEHERYVYNDVDLDDTTATHYDVFFLAKDDKTGRDIRNDWYVNDQAYCQSFNNVSYEHSYDVKNKYYWRLVTDILSDTYMNLTTGTTTSGNIDVNTVDISAPYLAYKINETPEPTYVNINTGWNITSEGSGAYWSSHPGPIQNASYGLMVTQTSGVGIKLTPRAGSNLSLVIPSKFGFGCSSARLNITVYYTDGTSQYFPAPEKDYFIEHPQTSYEVNLTASASISKIIITNADDVEWRFVHGIRLSNVSGEYDNRDFPNNPNGEQAYIGTSSIPSKGDNIAQLGYRWVKGDPTGLSRGNAIIIAAYRTPDFGTQGQQAAVGIQLSSIKPPSYAQYEAIGSDSSHYFDLAYYRKTYMDANGSKFYGDFYIRAQGQQGYENMGTDVAELKVGVQGVQAQVTNGIQGVQTQIDLSTNGVQAYIMNGLQSTGIDITSGRITLDGENVDVIGNLNVAGNQSAFQFVDDNGNVRLNIGNTSMPKKSDFLNAGYKKYFQGVYATASSLSGYTDYISIGQWNNGTISITSLNGNSLTQMYRDGGEGTFDGRGVTIKLKPSFYYFNGSTYTLISTASETSTSLNASGYFANTIGGGSFTGAQGNNTEYFVKYKWTVTGLSFTSTIAKYKINYAFTYTPNITKKHVYFSNDGFGILYYDNTSSYFYTGREETDIKLGSNSQILLNNGGVHIKRPVTHHTSASGFNINLVGDYYIESVMTNGNKASHNVLSYKPESGDYYRIYNLTGSSQTLEGYANYGGTYYKYKIVQNNSLVTVNTSSSSHATITLPAWTRTDLIFDGNYWMTFRYNIIYT